MTQILSMKGIYKEFPGVIANDYVDFSVNEGEIHALLGENGAGKTTLMRILYGLYAADKGEIFVKGNKVHIHSPNDAINLGIGMVHQEFMLVPNFTVTENVAMGMNITNTPFLELKPIEKKIRDISTQHGLAIDPTAYIQQISIGVQQRAEIIKLLCRDARLLILDEPTGVLTLQETEGLFDILRSLVCEGCAIVFITHKLNEVMSVSDRVTVLRQGKVVGVKNIKDTNQIELAEMMVGRDVLFRIHKKQVVPKEPVLQIEDLHASNDRGLPALNGISLEVREGEILGIAGVDGNGQSELAETLAGLRKVKSGRIHVNSKDVTDEPTAKRYANGMVYVPADRRMVGTVQSIDIAWNSILGRPDEFTSAKGLLLDAHKIEEHANQIVSQFDIRTPGINVKVEKLSGGNLQKLLLGRELVKHPKLLIVEQPTRGLDVGATEYIRNQILEAQVTGTAVLLISSELDEILDLSDRIAVIYEGKIMGIVKSGEAERSKIGFMMAGCSNYEDVINTQGRLQE